MRNIFLVLTMFLFIQGTSLSQDTCHSCNGTGTRQCSSCKGHGIGKCIICKGFGIIISRCFSCNGSGHIVTNTPYSSEVSTCTACQGSGETSEQCHICGGTGRGTCLTCFGTGRVKCRSCNGRGYIVDQKDTLRTSKGHAIYANASNIQMDSIPFFSRIGIYKCHILQDTIQVPIVVRQIDLDEYTSLTLVAADTIKPNTIGIIYESEEFIRDSIVIILNPLGTYIPLNRGIKSKFANMVKAHKIMWSTELSWSDFDQFAKLDRIFISTNRRIFDLEYGDIEIISAFHLYLSEHIDEEPSPPDFVLHDIDPVVIKKAEPQYPAEAIRKKIQGDVFMKLWVDRRGKVRKAIVSKSTNDIFIVPAIEAAKQFVFTPAKLQGKAISLWVTVPIRFRYPSNQVNMVK